MNTSDRNISNLLAGHSTFREGTCENFIFREGFYGYNSFPAYPPKLSKTAHTWIPVNAHQSLQFRIGRGDSASWKITADVLLLNVVQFELKSLIELFFVNGIESDHYITFNREGKKTFEISDSLVNKVFHGIVDNSKVVFAVFLRTPSNFPLPNLGFD